MNTTFLESILKTNAPWLYHCVTDVSSITDIAFKLNREFGAQFLTLRLRGCNMRNVKGLFDEFGAAIQFPYYFGKNWNAFDECIKDLDWLNVSGYLFIIHDADQVLVESQSQDDEIRVFVKILESAGENWSIPIKQDAAWDRPSKAFHVVFQTDNHNAESFRARLENANINIPNLIADLK